MKVISKVEAGEWCRSHGIPLGERDLPALWTIPDASNFPIPRDAGERVALAKEQVGKLAAGTSCLVWLDDWSVWPSGQWHHLFERFRLTYGCQDRLIDKPAHVIDTTELDAAISIVVYAILMLWDCYLITDKGSWVQVLTRRSRKDTGVRRRRRGWSAEPDSQAIGATRESFLGVAGRSPQEPILLSSTFFSSLHGKKYTA